MLIVALGTRPEFIKLKSLFKYWESIGFHYWNILLTGQHDELCDNLSKNWEFKDKCLPYLPMGRGSNRLDLIINECLWKADDAFIWGYGSRMETECSSILICGDTAQSFACALASFHRRLPIIHLEAGLRSYDINNPYPEEMYRSCISKMASIHLCPTPENKNNLLIEKVNGKIFVTGNTVLDNIKHIKPGFSNKILITMHRRESLEDIKIWFDTFENLARIYKEYEFILPIHKNPEIYKYKNDFKYVKCIDPLEHTDFINLLKDCAAVCSDSGGVIEEGSWFGKRIFLLRKETERPEAEAFYTRCPTPELLSSNFREFAANKFSDNLKYLCPFGDGNSAKTITDILIKEGYINVV